MQTTFAPAALADPRTRDSEKILRSCVHCGFCTATCPTYLLLGDELDSPRGRIYLIKDMLEGGKPATTDVVKHLDRCLSCLSCMTTCPSGVHYMHLIDHARAHVEETYRRPLLDRLLRAVLARVLPHPAVFRLALGAARFARPLRPAIGRLPGVGARLGAMLDLAPASLPPRPETAPPRRQSGPSTRRVALLRGCAQSVLRPSINEATTRLLDRLGVTIVATPGEGCCGALVHHMGRDADALGFARHNVDLWTRVIEREAIEAIVITASGCGTTIKDYGFMLREDPAYAEKARRVSAFAKDVTEFLDGFDLAPAKATGQVVAYHSACSMQHGQKIGDLPKRLLKRAGFRVKDVPEGHICCGSAGTYNILQPEIAARLRARKVANIERIKPELIATGNIGCITQIGLGTSVPILHTVELLDWATGGPRPVELPASSAPAIAAE